MDVERKQEELLAATRAVEDVPAAPELIVEEPRPVVVEHAVEHVDESVPSLPPATHPQPVPALSVSARAEPGSNSTCSGRSVTNGFRHIGTAEAKTSTTLEMGGGWSRRRLCHRHCGISIYARRLQAAWTPVSNRTCRSDDSHRRENMFPGALHLRYPGWKARH